MFLNRPQFQQLDEAFNDAFTTYVKLHNLAAFTWNQTLDQLGIQGDDTRRIVSLLLHRAEKDLKMVDLINAAILILSPQGDLQSELFIHIRDQLLPTISWHEKHDPLTTCYLREGKVMLDRNALRTLIGNLLKRDGKRILIVDGKRYSGKSHSWELIHYLETSYNFFKAVLIDLDRLSHSQMQANDLGRMMAWQMGLDPHKGSIPVEQEHWVQYFVDWLIGQLTDSDIVYWIVIDGFPEKLLSPRTQDLINALASCIDKQLDKLRLILLSYQDHEALNLIIPGRIEYEFIKPIEAKDLLPFFLTLYKERHHTQQTPYKSAQVINSAQLVWRQVNPEHPQRLRTLEQVASAEAQRILDPPLPMQEEQQLLAEMEEQLYTLNLSYDPSSAPQPPITHYGSYHQAAAVLSFFSLAMLKPISGISDHENREDVLKNCKLLSDERYQDLWMLQPEIRQVVIQQMKSRKALQHALTANLPLPDNPLQQMLSAYITGDAPPISKQDLSQVAASFQVVNWLEGVISDLPDRDAIQQRQQWLGLLQPFHELAGENFRGRQQELSMLYTYLGMPSMISNNASQDVAPTIYGPGGVGKSTLLAHLILENAQRADKPHFPWSYVDFERPGIRIEEPLTILIEATRQLGILYPESQKSCDKVRDTMGHQIIKYEHHRSTYESRAGDNYAHQRQNDWWRYSRDFAHLLRNLHVKQDSPFLLVLDTLERAQHHSNVVIASLCSFLSTLKHALPSLKTIFVGRAPLTGTPDYPTTSYELKGFDTETAQVYLENETRELLNSDQDKLLKSDQARKIISRLKPHLLPLTLKLMVLYLKKSDRTTLEQMIQDNLLVMHFEESHLQEQLLLRILGHVHDHKIHKLAYPGFVLRFVTPALIRHVLAIPCGITLEHPADEQRLFKILQEDESLVQMKDGSLYHRPELRTIMLKRIHHNDQQQALLISEAAVLYYEQQEGLSARAEELYHRLLLRQPIETLNQRWIDDNHIKNLLSDALDELTGPEKIWLAAHLGAQLTLDERHQADLESWERDTEQRTREFLQRDKAQSAITLLRERLERTSNSPLYELQAQAYELLQEWKDAIAVLTTGILSVTSAHLAGALRLHIARMETRRLDILAARKYLDDAEKLFIPPQKNTLFLLEIGLQRLGLDRIERKISPATFKEQLYLLFSQLSSEQITAQPVLMGWFAGELGKDFLDATAHIIQLTGLYTERMTAWRSLARTLIAWEQDFIEHEQWSKGDFARLIGLTDTTSSVEDWTAYLQENDASVLAQSISMLLDSQTPPPLPVFDALIDILSERAWTGPNPIAIVQPMSNRLSIPEQKVIPESGLSMPPQDQSSSTYKTASLGKLTPAQHSQFRDALLRAFPSPFELRSMLAFRLDMNLDALSLSNNFRGIVDDLVEQAIAHGWEAQILAAALDTNPRNPSLRAFAGQFGLVTSISSFRFEESHKSQQVPEEGSRDFTDPTRIDSLLGHLETQICRIEISHQFQGTGFLIGPDILLTSYHTTERIIKGEVSSQQMRLRFDDRVLSNNETVSTGTIYHLADNWLIDYSPEPQLDFVFCRISGAPGNEPIGGEQAEPAAPPRGWIIPATSSPAMIINAPLFILYYQEHGPLQISHHQHGIVGLNETGTRLSHRVQIEPGSSGAPCFNQNGELIAMQGKPDIPHHMPTQTAIPITAILSLLTGRHTFSLTQPPDIATNVSQLRQNVHLRIDTSIQAITKIRTLFATKGYISPRQKVESTKTMRIVRNNLLDLRQYLDDILLNPTTTLPDSIIQHYPTSIYQIDTAIAETEAAVSRFSIDNEDRQLIQRQTGDLIKDLKSIENLVSDSANTS